MNSAYDWLRRAKTWISGSAALLGLAVLVSAAAAQPTEVLVYQFDPAVDNLTTVGGIQDHSGNGYNGTALSFFSAPSTMKIVQGHLPSTFAVAMAGDDGFPGTGIWTGQRASTLGIAGGSFTVMAWVNRADLHTGDQMIFGTTGIETVGSALHLGFRGRDTYMGFWGNDSSAPAAPTPTASTWHHMAWRYDATKQNQDIILDGVLANSSANHGPFNHDQPVLIGRAAPAVRLDDGAFAGMIEYPRIFNGALTDAQIEAAAQDKPLPP